MLGSYEILQELHSNAATTTFRARRKNDGLPVILKVLERSLDTPDLLLSEVDGTSLPNEYVLLKKVQHISGCVKILDFIDDDDAANGKWTIVLEDLEAAGYINLASLLNRLKAPVNEKIASWIVRKLIEVLDEVHAAGLIHCDVKPDNIFVNFKSSLIKLIDFNSSISTCSVHNGPPPCTPDYAPPEVFINQKPWTISGEVWSIGCTAFVLLCGRFPFLNPWMSAYSSPMYPRSMSDTRTSRFGSSSFHYNSHFNKIKATGLSERNILSPRAKDFLLSCLNRSPDQRPQLKALLQHSFLRNVNKELLDTHSIEEALCAPEILVS